MAVHDQASGTLTLTRDPFGIKPLYTAAIPGGLAFASEPQALLAAGLVARALDPSARDALLQLQFYPGAASIFPGITRVLPGETLRVANGRVVARSRAPALAAGGPEAIDEASSLARLDTALRDSIDIHVRGDAPAALFLSGGIDSACLLACLARESEKPVLAFTAGFDVPGAADERATAETLARSVGARHVGINITASDMFKHLPAIVAGMDDPAADYAIIPSWFLARRAREEVKVVLSGEGGDEIFAGYGRYRDAIRPWYRGGKPMRRHGIFDRLELLRGVSAGWRDGLLADAASAAAPGRSPLQIAQATDVESWLPADLLLKLDRCLMAHGVEGRTPFLDPAVMAAGFRLPDHLKLRSGARKYLLRKWLQNTLPAARSDAPKQGFTVPVGAWIAAEGARLGPLVAAQPGVADIAAPDRVRALFRHAAGKREGVAAWTLLFYGLWHQAHILARPSDGSVFEVLGEAA